MQRIKTLIDKAAKVCGSQSALAANLDIHRSQLSEMKRGVRHISPEIAILIADIAMQNVADAALSAILENGQGTVRGERVQAAVGRSLINQMLELQVKSE